MRFVPLLFALLLASAALPAQHTPSYNYDEATIPPYTLLDPLRTLAGEPVTTPRQWTTVRRPEILSLFEQDVYGMTPEAAKHVPLRTALVEEDRNALGGTAWRRQIDVFFTGQGASGPKMRVLLYLPPHPRGRVPVVLGLNFAGNQSVLNDPAIRPAPVWIEPKGSTSLLHELPADSTRGMQTEEWQVRRILARGYGLATAYYGDLEADVPDAASRTTLPTSIRQLYPASLGRPDSWGAVGAWAWGFSRAVDLLEHTAGVDPHRIAVTGHSRLGKAADWAAAQDLRIAALLSTESGHGGQSIQRRQLGETVAHLVQSFGYWFCPAYAQWAGRDPEIPADGNLLLSLIAPRPLYVASAAGDAWSDPKGEFLSVESASRVYALLGRQGVTGDMPPVDTPVGLDVVAYHIRTGKHDVTAFDWESYLDFLDRIFPRHAPAPADPGLDPHRPPLIQGDPVHHWAALMGESSEQPETACGARGI